MFRAPCTENGSSRSLALANVQAALFDLDGTLVDVDMHLFVPAYLRRLARRFGDVGEPSLVAQSLRCAVTEMLNATDGRQTMEERLCARLAADCDIDRPLYQERLEMFCQEDLPELQPLVKAHPLARDLVESCLEHGWQPVLATNPIFPRAVVEARMAWGGLDDLPFALITTYETARYCKPHAGFFHEVLQILEVAARNCLMIGNDTQHDLAASQVGLQTCLLTPWRIDRPGPCFTPDWQGNHRELLTVLNEPSSTNGCTAPD